ncbi:MAG: glycosyltransferase family 2 protein [Phycisphaerales bacterium]
MISYVMPTRDRPERLMQTLDALGALRGHDDGGEVVIVDNASRPPPEPPARLANGMAVRVISLSTNGGAASRNVGVGESAPRAEWVVMLDDDSYPADTGFLRRLGRMHPDVAAVSADIYLPGLARRESGGLPEVFVGCGVAIRRKVFLDLGGYDAAFGYYAEEYDLAARMIAAGLRIVFDPWFRVEHHKVAQGRDMNIILARLIRNNGWVMERYAPESLRRAMLRDLRRRYRAIARKESALPGYAQGLTELRRTIRAQARAPMPRELFERFMGLSQAREALHREMTAERFATAQVVDEGKNGWVVRRALAELGVRVINDPVDPHPLTAPDALVIGTMSPGPMLDAYERRTALPVRRGPRVIAPWTIVMDRGLPRAPDVLTPEARAAAVRTPIPA